MGKANKPQHQGTLEDKANAGNPNAQARIKARDPVYVQQKLAEFDALSDPDKAKFLQANFYLRTPFSKAGVDLNYYLAGNFPLG